MRTLVHCVVKHSRPPDLKSASNVSLPFAWITGTAKDPSYTNAVTTYANFCHFTHNAVFIKSKNLCNTGTKKQKKYLLTLMDLHGSSKELDGTEPSLEPI